MGTPHINANKGDFGKVVLMPGDPLRAKWIAENYLKEPKLITSVRGILGYTGLTKAGKRVSVMASGMGMPSIGIYSHELFTYYDVDAIIRIGTCGAYQENINLFDVLVCATASTDSNWAGQFALNGGTFSAGADFDLVIKAHDVLKQKHIPLHIGNILSADVFYDEDPSSWKKWAKLGVMGVEMESYSLYVTAARLHKKALCLLTVTDHFIKEGKATSEERQTGLGKMVEVALEVADDFA
jgi:purine-nucleoside phosphorylase